MNDTTPSPADAQRLRGQLAIPKGYAAVALKLPGNLSFDDWAAIGTKLQAASAAVQWWLADWWAFGETKYGERAAQAMDPDFPWALQTCMNAARVGRRIETSRRREALTFAHHEAVAALGPKAQDEFLEQALAEGRLRTSSSTGVLAGLKGGNTAHSSMRSVKALSDVILT